MIRPIKSLRVKCARAKLVRDVNKQIDKLIKTHKETVRIEVLREELERR